MSSNTNGASVATQSSILPKKRMLQNQIKIIMSAVEIIISILGVQGCLIQQGSHNCLFQSCCKYSIPQRNVLCFGLTELTQPGWISAAIKGKAWVEMWGPHILKSFVHIGSWGPLGRAQGVAPSIRQLLAGSLFAASEMQDGGMKASLAPFSTRGLSSWACQLIRLRIWVATHWSSSASLPPSLSSLEHIPQAPNPLPPLLGAQEVPWPHGQWTTVQLVPIPFFPPWIGVGPYFHHSAVALCWPLSGWVPQNYSRPGWASYSPARSALVGLFLPTTGVVLGQEAEQGPVVVTDYVL